MLRPQERRRLPRGPQLGVHLTLHALRWVYVYVGLLALLVMLPDLLSWLRAADGSPAELAAAKELGRLAGLIVAPFGLLAVVISIHVGWVAGRATRFVSDMDVPFNALRDRVARQHRMSRRLVSELRKLTDHIDDDPRHDRELSAKAHAVRDLAEEQTRRPKARTLDLRVGERTPATEAHVASALN